MNQNLYPPPKERQANDLRHLVVQAAERNPEKDYLVYKRNGTLESVTFEGFRERMFALGEAFFEIGVAGGTVAVLGETSPEWILTYLAAVNSSSVIVPLDKELARDEICNFINKVGCKCVVFSKDYGKYFENREAFGTVEYFVEFGAVPKEFAPSAERVQKGQVAFLDLLALGREKIAGGSVRFAENPIDLEKTCAILFTSGTTGTSKGVMLCQRNLVAGVNASHNMTEFCEDDTIVSVLPIHHTYEMTCGILTPILIGATVAVNDSLKYVVRNFQTFRPTGLVLVPLFVSTIYKKIWETAKKSHRDKLLKGLIGISGALRKVKIDPRKVLFKSVNEAFGGRLVRIICGGAPMPAELVKEFDNFGIALCQGYGITECAPLISVCPEHANRAGSVGLPVPGVEVRIDKEEGEEYGEILVKGPNVMQGYFEDEEATRAVFRDGWFCTGDYGYQDEDGYLYITGRKKNVIVLNNGKNVFPEEIEEYLEKIDLICECAVVGRTNPENDTVAVTALIYPDFAKAAEKGLGDDLNLIGETIKKEIGVLNRSLPSFKQIRGIELRRTEFDKTTTKKIKRYKIQESK